ncbi:hypothetical protein MRB53_039946 [Persea americana]|nr:hypothetical protein MRB53_039946 [Persea americana]
MRCDARVKLFRARGGRLCQREQRFATAILLLTISRLRLAWTFGKQISPPVAGDERYGPCLRTRSVRETIIQFRWQTGWEWEWEAVIM